VRAASRRGVAPDGPGERGQHDLDQRRACGHTCRGGGLSEGSPENPVPAVSGTVAKWKLQATKSRVRDVQVDVDVAGHTVIEKDANSSMVTNWTVAPAGPGSSVTVKTTWTGAGGVKGFFEKTFAPLGLKKIQAEVLANLKKELET
jgi:hypothetical protein